MRRIVAQERSGILDAISRSLRSGTFIGGADLGAFEADFANVSGARNCVGVGNGFDASTLILKAMGVGRGDEVIVPGMTFVATLLSVIHTGATPVVVDVEPRTGNINPNLALQAVTERTKAIIAVHLHGLMADMPSLRSVASANQLLLVEDAAQAHGAFRGDDVAGSSGDAAAFSFYPTKNLGALGDGGCVTTRDSELASMIRRLANYGSLQTEPGHVVTGVNSRLDSLQANILRYRLGRLNADNMRRRQIAELYLLALGESKACRPLSEPPLTRGSSWHHFVIVAKDRAAAQKHFGERGIQTMIHYSPAPYRLPEISLLSRVSCEPGKSLAACDLLSQCCLSIPLHPWLRDDEVERIVLALGQLN